MDGMLTVGEGDQNWEELRVDATGRNGESTFWRSGRRLTQRVKNEPLASKDIAAGWKAHSTTAPDWDCGPAESSGKPDVDWAKAGFRDDI